MAKNTAISAQTGAPALLQKIWCYQRTIDFSATNLASGDHFELFQLEAGDVVIAGAFEVVTAGTGNHDATLGVGGTGTTLLTATPVDTEAVTALTIDAPIVIGADTVDLAMTVANATTGVVRVTIAVLKAGDFAG